MVTCKMEFQHPMVPAETISCGFDALKRALRAEMEVTLAGESSQVFVLLMIDSIAMSVWNRLTCPADDAKQVAKVGQ